MTAFARKRNFFGRTGFHMSRFFFRTPLRGALVSTCLALPGGFHVCLRFVWGTNLLFSSVRGN